MLTQNNNRRQTLPVVQKRRKPRRQSGQAVAFENRESVVQKARVERTDSDKVIRRNSMARKLSVRNSMKLPADFLESLKGLDSSLTRMSLVAATARGGHRPSLAEALANASGSAEDDTHINSSNTSATSLHGPEFSEAQLQQMSEQALQSSDDEESEEESVVSEVMEEVLEETMEDL